QNSFLLFRNSLECKRKHFFAIYNPKATSFLFSAGLWRTTARQGSARCLRKCGLGCETPCGRPAQKKKIAAVIEKLGAKAGEPAPIE
ncbi:MAG: hypothetical protein RR996_04580, partial [Alistipes sp.]